MPKSQTVVDKLVGKIRKDAQNSLNQIQPNLHLFKTTIAQSMDQKCSCPPFSSNSTTQNQENICPQLIHQNPRKTLTSNSDQEKTTMHNPMQTNPSADAISCDDQLNVLKSHLEMCSPQQGLILLQEATSHFISRHMDYNTDNEQSSSLQSTIDLAKQVQITKQECTRLESQIQKEKEFRINQLQEADLAKKNCISLVDDAVQLHKNTLDLNQQWYEFNFKRRRLQDAPVIQQTRLDSMIGQSDQTNQIPTFQRFKQEINEAPQTTNDRQPIVPMKTQNISDKVKGEPQK